MPSSNCPLSKSLLNKMIGLIYKSYHFCRLYFIYAVVTLLICAYTIANKTYANNVADYEISAVYIYRFSQFVTWPEGNTTLTYCTLGTDNIALTLSRLLKAKNNKIVTLTSISQLAQCQIAYISRQKGVGLTQIPIERGVLTIGTGDSFLEKGGIIELRSVNNKVRPVIALSSAKKSELTISSKLLKIAILPSLNSEQQGGDNHAQ
ncbi:MULTISPECIES: YfiR family protein [unclassified Photobacterium]|uniref:YfiR family protein n=1 Tax=unclassified Photobacterium TaxID=2628852 RepID=UPI001EE0E038|nr:MULTISPECIES: YfiR family protein [unclassified Photobacterium]MCG3865813.1 YfiR family protein [Photobacterium sp. Ph6]MCG3877288.1 YfiR family protein [Photobacterium sp. Ph5]